MLKRIFWILFLVFIFSGCNSNATVPTQPSLTADLDYPILFVDTTNDAPQAYILCAYSSGNLLSPEDYTYSDKPLAEYLRAQNEPVSSKIINTDKMISFYDVRGQQHKTNITQVSCSGRIIDESVEVRATLEKSPEKQGLFWGTYAELDLLPQNIIFSDRSISVDLDSDGELDTISWIFTSADSQEYGENYYFYEIMVTAGAKAYSLEGPGHLPCTLEDFSIYVADLDMNGTFELLVYSKGLSRFRYINAYQLDKDKICNLFSYVIDPEP